MGEPSCAICGGSAEVHSALAGPLDVNYFVECPVCGDYQIADKVVKILRREQPQNRYILSGVIRRAKEDNLDPPAVTAGNYELLMSESQLPAGGILSLLDLIVQNLARRADRFGAWVALENGRDYPIAFAKEPDEFSDMIEALQGRGLVESDGILRGTKYRLTLDGWKKAEDLRHPAPGKGNQCFVAMSFAKELRPVYLEGIAPALETTGYKPRIMWEFEHNGKIDDQIIAEIRQSRLVVADFTEAECRGGVYFEAGFALGLRIPVIWACRADQLKANKLHFDTRQYNHIEWENHEDLRMKLETRIRATHPLRPTGGDSTGVDKG